ncbi:cytochrome P450 [Chroococcidiopsis sp. FACHB-1243]|uniref:cytochrome P450 n=1 Tax=Chroococcidiopsis sp. [FACHB-1243] TaxID=2692781 RepID=UPI00177BE0CE|nr:cytochrome P450 [Chroococcidiopsis sp. [FACHB-1243]]MBD2309009.1 cytochrome P450 [Chroococcidiopsis sp. [FACHB-1243]]
MEIPEIEKIPLWVHAIKIATDPLNHLDTLGKDYGDIFTINFGSTPVVFVSNPQAIKQIFTNTKEIKSPGELNQEMALITGNQGLLQLDGSRHKHRRKLIMPAFHGVKMQAQGQRICHLTEKVMGQHLVGKTFITYPTVEDITLQVSMEVVLGLREGERYEQLKQLLPAILKYMRSPIMQITSAFPSLQQDLGRWSPWGYLMYLRQEIFQLLYAEVQERRTQADFSRTDILSELIFARDEAGESMTDEEIRDLLLSPLFAAQDATAVAITWLLYWVHRLPAVRERLLGELDSLGDSPDPMSIIQLPYLNAVCNEALRIYPTQLFTFPRRVESPTELMGYELSPKTLLMGCIYLTHQREDLYSQPKQFQPERFLERQYSPYEFLAFGGGTRGCIGAGLAVFEMKLVLATILSRYQLALVKKKPEQPKFEGLMCYPASGVKMAIRKRDNIKSVNLKTLFASA